MILVTAVKEHHLLYISVIKICIDRLNPKMSRSYPYPNVSMELDQHGEHYVGYIDNDNTDFS